MSMFCFQCEQTAGGKGCTKQGVCGKTPEAANLQDDITAAMITLARAVDGKPAERVIASRKATVEPLPLVPPTLMIVGAGSGEPIRCQTTRMRSSPSSISRGWMRCW